MKKGLLVVSFGSSYAEARTNDIAPLEKAVAAVYPDHEMRIAYGSKMIIRKLKTKDGIQIDTVEEALHRMIADEFTDIVVQPTYMICGYEYEWMADAIKAVKDKFSSVKMGMPLLTDHEDYEALTRGLIDEFSLGEKQALVLMGHGTNHPANSSYPALNFTFKTMGADKLFLGTVEGYPDIDLIKEMLRGTGTEEVIMTPLMMVAGDHANNDMAGDDEDSWNCQLTKEGYKVSCVIKGLGSYPFVQEMIAQHAADAKEL